MILMVFISFLQAKLGGIGPMQNKDRMIELPRVKIQKEEIDSIFTYDTTLVNGIQVIDSTFKTNDVNRSTSTSNGSRSIFENHLPKIQNAEVHSIFCTNIFYDAYVNNNKINVTCTFSDAQFWDIYTFDFVEGRPFSATEFNNAAHVVVISEEMAMEYFGRKNNVLDEEIKIDNKTYKIIGLIRTSPNSRGELYSKAYLAYTHLPPDPNEGYYLGGFNASLLANHGISIPILKEEIQNVVQQIPIENPAEYDELIITPFTPSERMANNIYWHDDPRKSYTVASSIILSLLSLIIFLPSLNLINLNVSRILDRSSEIGVRKAFGASKYDVLFQFMFENIILTLIGGLIGLVLSIGLIYLINDSKILEVVHLPINWNFFLYSFVVCILFGVISGILPALKMSNIPIVKAIKQTQL